MEATLHSTFVLLLLVILLLGSVARSETHPYGAKVYTIGEEMLRKAAKQVSVHEIKTSPVIQKAMEDSYEALSNFRKKMGYGRAIAAPQVGSSVRLVTTTYHGKPEYLFNPTITYRSSETFSMWDDCLSLPNMMVCVRRNKCISVQFLDENGKEQHWENCPQDLSELLQHEIDHLDGVLAVDRMDYDLIKTHRQTPLVTRDEWLKSQRRFNAMVDFKY